MSESDAPKHLNYVQEQQDPFSTHIKFPAIFVGDFNKNPVGEGYFVDPILDDEDGYNTTTRVRFSPHQNAVALSP